MTKLSKRSSKECPSRLTWFAIGGSAALGLFFAYGLYWSGFLGSLPKKPLPAPSPKTTPASPEGSAT